MSQSTHPVELKVKAISLAQEARVIRRLAVQRKRAHAYRERAAHETAKKNESDAQTVKALGKALKERLATSIGRPQTIQVVNSLEVHRRGVVREAARTCHLARAFLKGQPYSEVENFAYQAPRWEEVEKLASRYSALDERAVKQMFAEWLFTAKAHYDATGEKTANGSRVPLA